jgi:hypothetical protein
MPIYAPNDQHMSMGLVLPNKALFSPSGRNCADRCADPSNERKHTKYEALSGGGPGHCFAGRISSPSTSSAHGNDDGACIGSERCHAASKGDGDAMQSLEVLRTPVHALMHRMQEGAPGRCTLR